MFGRRKAKVYVFPLPQEVIDPLILAQPSNRRPVPPQPAPNVGAVLVRPADVLRAAGLCAVGLGHGPDEAHEHDDGGKGAVRHVDGLAGLAAAPLLCLAPALPVLPGGVVGGGPWLVAPGPVDVAQGGEGLVAVGPAEAVGVVHAALGGVAEEFVCGDDHAVSLEAGCGREGLYATCRRR